MRKNIIIIVGIILALILCRALISYSNKIKTGEKRRLAAVPAVTVAVVESDSVRRQFETTARVVAKYRVEVLARISGYLTKSYFKEGDYVKAGQILFEIEPQEYKYAADKAKANWENVKAQADYYNKQLARYEELVGVIAYYDLMGRHLQAPPRHGVYLLKKNNVITKVLAE